MSQTNGPDEGERSGEARSDGERTGGARTEGEHTGVSGTGDAHPRPARGRELRWAAVVVVVVAVALAGFLVGRLGAPRTELPATDSAAAGFARDMQAHHAQAVEMSMVVRDRTLDEDVRVLAYDIALSQQHQIGQMHAWLVAWGLPQSSSAPPMAWMTATSTADHATGHPAGDDRPMMGMASQADLDRLGELTDTEVERLFLELMITHHEGGVAMARAVLEAPAPTYVHRLGQAVVDAQESEIAAMTEMLAEREPVAG